MKKERLRAISTQTGKAQDRIAHMIEHMAQNKACTAFLHHNPEADSKQTIAAFQKRFLSYRESWQNNAHRAFQENIHGEALRKEGFIPLSVDLELSAMCDLACAFCYRQHIATPDKLMEEALLNSVIDQAAAMGVPSMKFNWRGEPLLHPRLPQAVARAKEAGILDTIINTNAVTLSEEKSRALIDAGLDLIIYSFDGGTAASYEKMRPGRFQQNRFAAVYGNIRRFAEIRKEMGSEFPRTKIQMLLTTETLAEQESFFNLFADCVDDVSVKAYTERGGSLSDLDDESRERIQEFLRQHTLPADTPYWENMAGEIFVAVNRLPCEQPYQRIMVSYDGRAAMCCYDWGCEHPIGYLSSRAFTTGDADSRAALAASNNQAKGFELIHDLRLPRPHIQIPETVQTLEEIWYGEIVNEVRRKHIAQRIEDIRICRQCPFKETYNWKKIEESRQRGLSSED